MARNVLVIGGTRFFGKKLVHLLEENGDRVTVASRNFTKADFSSSVLRRTIDRESEVSMATLLGDHEYDLVYDQIGFSPTAADFLCKSLESRVEQLVFTSTQAVYTTLDKQVESDFDPFTYQIAMGGKEAFNYGEGKRLAEAVFFQRCKAPVTAIRFPYVLGNSDYTGRLDFHIKRVAQGSPIIAANPDSWTSLISADEAATFLFWAGNQNIAGPINACSFGTASVSKIIQICESILKKKAVVLKRGPETDQSPYAEDASNYMDNTKANDLGFKFSEIDDWLPQLIRSRVDALDL